MNLKGLGIKRVLHRSLIFESSFPLQSDAWVVSCHVSRVIYVDFLRELSSTYQQKWAQINTTFLHCKNVTQTAAQVWFILIILFGVFTNKHMQEVDSDWHYRGTELYAIVGHGGDVYRLHDTRERKRGGGGRRGGEGGTELIVTLTHT